MLTCILSLFVCVCVCVCVCRCVLTYYMCLFHCWAFTIIVAFRNLQPKCVFIQTAHPLPVNYTALLMFFGRGEENHMEIYTHKYIPWACVERWPTLLNKMIKMRESALSSNAGLQGFLKCFLVWLTLTPHGEEPSCSHTTLIHVWYGNCIIAVCLSCYLLSTSLLLLQY